MDPDRRIEGVCKVARFGLYDRICKALNEKDVENVYRELFHVALPDSEIVCIPGLKNPYPIPRCPVCFRRR